MLIRTTHRPAPIGNRSYDWQAIDEETYDGADDSRTRHDIGYGATEREAVIDLLDRLDERDAPPRDNPQLEFKTRELRGLEPL
jgi:hypothetical protein